MFSADEVQNAFSELLLNKAGGLDRNDLKFAFDILHKHAVNLFNLCIKHAYVPNNFTTNLIVPVLKDKLWTRLQLSLTDLS